jgi:hypothetical protein
MKGAHHSPASILRRVAYPVEPFRLGQLARQLQPPLLQRERDRLRQQPGLFDQVNDRQADQFKDMKRTSVKAVALILCLSALPLMVGLTGCAGNRYSPSTGHSLEDQSTAERGYSQSTDQIVEDRRTAERAREALAAAPGYKFDGVKVMAGNGVVQLSGFVNTSAQRTSAGEVTGKVAGVKRVENNLAVNR